MKTHVTPSICNSHVVTPPSKGMAHRVIIYTSLANSASIIKNVAYSQDIRTTIVGMQQLGADIRMEAGQITVTGIKDFTIKSKKVLCRESGPALRFFIPIFSLCSQETTPTGQGRLLQCPQKVYESLLHAQGFTFRQGTSGITIYEYLKSGDITLQGGVSSQFINGLLFILSLLQEGSTIHILPPFEFRSHIDLMLQMPKAYGIQASFENDLIIHILGNQQYTAYDCTIEGDYSQFAFFAVLAAYNHDLTITGVHHDSRQGGKKTLSILKDFGARVEEIKNGYHIYKSGLHGCRIDLASCPNFGPILTVPAMYSPGSTNIYNIGGLCIKESDRIGAMEQGLHKSGVDTHSTESEIFITGDSFYTCASEPSSHNDYRTVMTLSVATTCSNTSCIIDGAQAVQKSYPTFFEDLQPIDGRVELL